MSEIHHLLAGLPGGPRVLLQDSEGRAEPRWLLFLKPVAVLVAERLGDVVPLLAEVDARVRGGRWAAGFLSYEAGPALDPALAAFESQTLPLAWWGIFDQPEEVAVTVRGPGSPVAADWRPAVSRRRYRQAIEHIHAHIADGNTYQVNYTFPLTARFEGEPERLFAALAAAQRARYCAYLDTGRFAICSASPELFFALDGERIVARPMKGTARRGRYPQEDAARAEGLAASEKQRAENLMIVDMMRNDLGRIATPGSVEVEELFAVETYPTVHQLTSTVSARTRASITEILRALFPSASITGAPKISTSRIIRRLEVGPRGVYTGSIGFFAPQRRAQLNVAIRTATVDRQVTPEAGKRGVPPQGDKRNTVTAIYGTGGGIVWDSEAEAEYQECRAKALVLSSAVPELALLETLLWCPESGCSSEGGRTGYFLLDRHLDRLLASARYFAFPLRRANVAAALESRAAGFEATHHRVRLLAHRDARLEITAEPWDPAGPCVTPEEGQRNVTPEGGQRNTWNVALDDRPVDDADPLLFHKTTCRDLYTQALRRHPQADEVVLWNARGELTESTRANLALKLDGRWLTPPVGCGLLAGTYRAELLARGRIQEQVLPVAAFEEAEEIFLINSLRGWIRARPTRSKVLEQLGSAPATGSIKTADPASGSTLIGTGQLLRSRGPEARED